MLKKKFIKFLTFTYFTPLALLLIFGCRNQNNVDNKSNNNIEIVRKIESVAALGQLNPMGEVRKLAAPTTGRGGTPRLIKLLINEGEYIVRDQVLAVFDNRSKLEADLVIEEARLDIVINQISIQKREINRFKKLLNKGAIAEITLEKMLDDLLILQGQKHQILAIINAIKIDLEQTQLKSPINGIVLQILAREGERPDSSGVINVGANQKMEALIEVYESDIDRIKIGQAVDLTSENGGFKGSLNGQVSLISPQVRQRRVLSTDPTGDADSRIIEVRVKLDNISAKMVSHLTGMKVIARFKP